MPGPNFNFAAFCGALAMRDNVGTSLAGGTLAWIGIFLPGLLLKAAILPLWKEYRGIPRVKAAFKGFNSVAVGLVFAATYVLFQKAISDGALGPSLGMYPFYVAVTGVSYVLVEHLKVPAPYVVILGGVVGAVEWAVTRNRA
ncbi:chromate transporter [Chytridium lagenaria]|nr:chromate transporter [Chytridium lagenaria]